MSDDWDDIAEWWITTIRNDPADSEETQALLGALVDPNADRTLDLGCGDGQALGLLGDGAIGVDLSHRLLTRAVRHAPVVRCRLPDLSWVRRGSFDQAVAVGLLDLLTDHIAFFEQAASAVRTNGALVIVMNHPVLTAPGSEPLVDESGEVMWRWGRYLERGTVDEPADRRTVELQHRPLGVLLTSAADAGWRLEHMIERGPTPFTIEALPHHRGHEHLPSLLGVRWRRS
jgi:SAM-dependent methyltransferase